MKQIATSYIYNMDKDIKHVRQRDKDVINYKHEEGEKIQSKQP